VANKQAAEAPAEKDFTTYLGKAPTVTQARMIEWLQTDEVGYDASTAKSKQEAFEEGARLTFALRMDFQRSEFNQDARQDSIDAKAEAKEATKAKPARKTRAAKAAEVEEVEEVEEDDLEEEEDDAEEEVEEVKPARKTRATSTRAKPAAAPAPKPTPARTTRATRASRAKQSAGAPF
jgi:hypothetical protein